MNRQMRIAALLVASLSLVGCKAPHEAREQAPSSPEAVQMAIPDPSGPAHAAQRAADQANDAAAEDQQTIDDLTSP